MNEPFDDNRLNPAEKEFERALSDLPAAQTSLDPQAIWAMSISRRDSHRLWFWRITSASLAASLLIVLWARRPANGPRPPQIVYVHDQQTTLSAQSIRPSAVAAWSEPTTENDFTDEEPDNYLRMRQRVMQKGLNALTLPQFPVAKSSDSGAPPPSERATHGRGARATSTAPEVPADVERAIQPPAAGPVYQFFNVLNQGSQL